MIDFSKYETNKEGVVSKEELFDIIFNNIDVGIDVIDDKGHMIYYNKAMEKLEGLNAKEVLGKLIFDIFPSVNYGNSTMFKCLKTGKPIFNNVQSYINNKGREIHAIITNIPIISNGKIKGVAEFALDMDMIGKLHKTFTRWYYSKDIILNTEKDKKGVNYYTFEDFKTRNQELYKTIKKLQYVSKYDYNVLIFGETGTGKEILAQSIHNSSFRRNKPFIAQNCAAVPENLLESIFFGTEKGSFTGAEDRPGLFELADGGTLFLDELNSLPIYPQAKLLRVIEEGYIRRLGSEKDKKVDVRVIATVNKDCFDLINQGKLREDLFYRISQIYAEIPPLRERKEDIIYLGEYFINKNAKRLNIEPITMSSQVKKFFLNYPWLGNIRELKNVIVQSMINVKVGNENQLKINHLPNHIVNEINKQVIENILKSNKNENYEQRIIEIEKKIILEALETTKGNVSEAARLLKIKRQTLQYKIEKYKIKYE